jgi:hypothetical protein
MCRRLVSATMGLMPGLPCRIIVRGELSECFDRGFAGLSPCRHDGRTELSGTLTSQSDLISVLSRLLDLDLPILSIRLGHEPGREVAESRAPGGMRASTDLASTDLASTELASTGAADVVNRLFSVGLTLAGLQTLVGDDAAAGHLARAVGELDDAIRQFRNAALR